jgi:hypothetical protein
LLAQLIEQRLLYFLGALNRVRALFSKLLLSSSHFLQSLSVLHGSEALGVLLA